MKGKKTLIHVLSNRYVKVYKMIFFEEVNE